ncbi:MAG: hypothetical protein KDD50_11355, partial [Bdellovibrionales bacterium]|nr:hypothetical protein [Bdellovibrionales bacterium]
MRSLFNRSQKSIKGSYSFSYLAFFSFLVFYSPASFSFTLKELYEVSLQNSEAIRVKKLDVEIARKTHSQVFSAI